MFENMQWENEPKVWKLTDNQLQVITDENTDFWRKTYYGFIRHDGHFYYKNLSGNFSIEVTLTGNYQQLYEQMGIMVKIDEARWIKSGIEFTDGALHLSAVVTNELSDWSVQEYSKQNKELTLKLIKIDSFVVIKYLNERNEWTMLRLTAIDDVDTYKVGIMACSPTSFGFNACFRNLKICENLSNDNFDIHQ